MTFFALRNSTNKILEYIIPGTILSYVISSDHLTKILLSFIGYFVIKQLVDHSRKSVFIETNSEAYVS